MLELRELEIKLTYQVRKKSSTVSFVSTVLSTPVVTEVLDAHIENIEEALSDTSTPFSSSEINQVYQLCRKLFCQRLCFSGSYCSIREQL